MFVPTLTLLSGDARQILKSLPDESIDCCVTSPPYYGLRHYGCDRQIGLEDSVGAYIDNLVAVFAEVKRLLKKTGTLWVNMGDTYVGTGDKGIHRDPLNPIGRSGQAKSTNKIVEGLPPKNLIGVPWRLAFALQADGWILRQDIIWEKLNPMPESVRDRCSKAHEYIFLLSKSRKYFFDQNAIKVPIASATASKKPSAFGGVKGKNFNPKPDDPNYRHGKDQYGRLFDYKKSGYWRNKRSVWATASEPYRGAHFAAYPTQLIRPCILAGCPKHGIVLDPFLGSGTTLLVAKEEHRSGIGVEINPEYLSLAHQRIQPSQYQPCLF